MIQITSLLKFLAVFLLLLSTLIATGANISELKTLPVESKKRESEAPSDKLCISTGLICLPSALPCCNGDCRPYSQLPPISICQVVMAMKDRNSVSLEARQVVRAALGKEPIPLRSARKIKHLPKYFSMKIE